MHRRIKIANTWNAPRNRLSQRLRWLFNQLVRQSLNCIVLLLGMFSLLASSCPLTDLPPSNDLIPTGNTPHTGGSHPSPHTPSGSSVAGDLDGDNVVGDSDAAALVSTLVDDFSTGQLPDAADVNGDGAVNGLDIQAFVDAYLHPILQGSCCSSNGSCTIATAEACQDAGGTYRGDGTTCATACPSSPAPQITDVAIVFPNVPGPFCNSSGSQIILSISGSDFALTATISLHQDGQTDRSPLSVDFATADQIQTTFNLNGAAAGDWQVIVTNPDNQSATSAIAVPVRDCF